tara:strand:- start:28 stop:423 length:396 start_codon:yes stop_codon:yes gene_type:complete
MTWDYITCSEDGCGEQVTIGHYGLGDYEDEYADYEIIATCGACIREKKGIPSREEEEEQRETEFNDFQSRVENEGIMNVIDFDNVGDFKQLLLHNIEAWKAASTFDMKQRFLHAIHVILKMVPDGVKVVAE